MSIQQLKEEVRALSVAERRELIGYLIALGRPPREATDWDSIAARLGDHDPAHWASEGDLDRVLRLDQPEA